VATERTFSIIKPDATRRNLTGAINAVFEEAGLRIVGQRRMQLTEAQAKKFYEVTRRTPVLRRAGRLQMTSEPVVIQVLEGDNAVLEVPRSDGRDQPG
jgi:nucleoside-diphosphate kinase